MEIHRFDVMKSEFRNPKYCLLSVPRCRWQMPSWASWALRGCPTCQPDRRWLRASDFGFLSAFGISDFGFVQSLVSPKPSIHDGSFQNENYCRLPVSLSSGNWAQGRLIGFGAKSGAEQPVSFEALNEFVAVNDRFGDRAQDIRIGLDLRIQVTGQACKIVERTTKTFD
jgi:hypothetical protein